jgi:hypothetical protein
MAVKGVCRDKRFAVPFEAEERAIAKRKGWAKKILKKKNSSRFF